jgi:protocatechuate 3,4-dioxygenase beta subunit
LGNLGVGALTLTASAEGWAGSLPLTLDLAPAGSVDDVVLTLRLGGTLTGEVFGADGKPEANRGIQLIGSRGGGQDDIITDAKGWFEITHLTPGKYQVMAEPSSEAVLGMMESGDTPDIGAIFSSLKMASAEVFEGETTHVVLGEEPKNPVEVSGHVTEAGEPVGGVMVAAISEGGNVLSGLAMSQTKPDGSYKLKLKRPGPTVFSVQAFRVRDIQFFADVPEAETFIFDMAMPLGTITGTVYGPKGSPVAGVPLLVSQGGGVFSLSDMDGNRSRVQTDEKGNYMLSHLTPGTYTIRAGGPGTRFANDSAPYGLSIHSDVVVRNDERTSGVDLTLGGAARILGSVMDADGNTVAQAAIFVYDDQGHVLSPISMCNSDSRGRFIYSGISPGTYTVAAVLNGTCSPTSAPVRVDLGTEPEVHLRLDAGTTLVVILEDREGNAVRARVRVVDAAGREVGTRMSADRLADLLGEGFSTREQRFGPLPPGKYRVIATAEDGRGANKPVTIKGQDERKVKLRLK